MKINTILLLTLFLIPLTVANFGYSNPNLPQLQPPTSTTTIINISGGSGSSGGITYINGSEGKLIYGLNDTAIRGANLNVTDNASEISIKATIANSGKQGILFSTESGRFLTFGQNTPRFNNRNSGKPGAEFFFDNSISGAGFGARLYRTGTNNSIAPLLFDTSGKIQLGGGTQEISNFNTYCIDCTTLAYTFNSSWNNFATIGRTERTKDIQFWGVYNEYDCSGYGDETSCNEDPSGFCSWDTSDPENPFCAGGSGTLTHNRSRVDGNGTWWINNTLTALKLQAGNICYTNGTGCPANSGGSGLNGTAQAGNFTYWNNATYLNSSKLKENSTFIGITNSSGYILIGFYHLPTADIRRQALLVGTGLEAEPTIRPSGDPNTGFWFPFDDDLRVSIGGIAWQRFTGGSQPTVAFDSRVRFSWNDGVVGSSTIAGFSLGKNSTSGGFKQAINLTGNSATQTTNSTLNTLAVHFPVGDYGNTLPACASNTNRTLSANNSGLYYCQTNSVWGRVTIT
jgi:hypothetical protein